MARFMIYGANGYSGELIAREAVARGQEPVLAGRSADKIQPLADELGMQARIFDVNNAASHLKDIDLVLHCAGPFSATSAPMIEACLAAKAHYLDITGEIDVFEHAHAQHSRAQQAGVVLCSGVGFDVIPTDCIALRLKEALPSATHLSLGFESRSKSSPGTARSTVEGFAAGGRIRVDGEIQETKIASLKRTIDFGNGPHMAVSIPWGDVSTAYYTTGIPNIVVYMSVPESVAKGMKRANWLRPLARIKPLQNILKNQAAKRASHMDEEEREQAPTYVWGEATNDSGDRRTARVKTANGYTVTIHGSLAVTEFLLGCKVDGGYYTPARLVGPELVEDLPGSGKLEMG